LSDESSVPLSERSFTASTSDGSVFVRVAVRGHILGVQLEPAATRRVGRELAEAIMACADVAYLEGQVAVRTEWERARVSPDALEGMPTADDLALARERLRRL
jgi:hypothetical protein